MAIDYTDILAAVKMSLRIITAAFDDELTDLIDAAMLDLGIAGVTGANVSVTDPLVKRAIITYCRCHFGQPDDYDRIKRSYDEQKAQLSTATGYTVFLETGDNNG